MALYDHSNVTTVSMTAQILTFNMANASAYWYDVGHTLADNRDYYRLLDIRSEGNLQCIMMAFMPWLSLQVHQINTGIPLLQQRSALTYALFIEAADRELPALNVFRRLRYFMKMK
ncbi:hypothetical protein NLW63_002102 [Salmonella enterica]|nr:hypothetical protein [Salmonella enterica]